MTKRYKAKRSDKQTSTILRVPNDGIGRAFVEQLRFFSAGGTRIRLRGRGPRAKHAKGAYRRAYDQSIPAELAEYFAVYIEKTECISMRRDRFRLMSDRYFEADSAIRRLTARVQQLTQENFDAARIAKDREEVIRQRDFLQRELQRLRDSREALRVELSNAREALKIMAEHGGTVVNGAKATAEPKADGSFMITIQVDVKPGKA